MWHDFLFPVLVVFLGPVVVTAVFAAYMFALVKAANWVFDKLRLGK